jgi:uncharacterized protein
MKKNFIEPNLLFLEEKISIGNKKRSEEMLITELVKKNQPILSWPRRKSSTPQDIKKRPVHSGRNTHFSEDGDTLIASIIGYPRVDKFKHENSDDSILLISIDPLVHISNDAMQATLALHPVTKNGFSPRTDTLSELLDEANINYGIDEKALQKAMEIIEEENNDFHDIPIATGLPPQAGVDEYLEFAFEIGPIAGTILKDGTIDFRERKIMIGVSSNELLATRIKAVPGVAGINVNGEDVEPDGGKEIKIKLLNDTSYSEETGEIRATKDGVLTVVKGAHIRVCSRQVIDGDINYETGNVESKNCVTVQGSVQPGFKLEANGDIEIRREVMSATLSCKSNVVIKGGITGKNTVIQADGDVDFFFIEHGKITAGGNIVVRKQTYYSDVAAGSNIRYQAGSKLIGGNITAGRNISISSVGSENSTPAHLAAGVDFERLQYYYKLKEERNTQQDILIQWMQRHGASAKSRKVRQMEKAIDEIKMKLLKLNLIPETLKYSRVGALKEKIQHDDEGQSIEKKGLDISKIHIDIEGTMYAGTELRIGNQNMTLTQTISNRRIKLNKKQKRLIATPLKGV